MDIGVINLSAEFSKSYFKALKKNGINVITLTMEDFEQKISAFSVIVIRENSTNDIAQTCDILLKIKEKSDICVWVFSSNPQNIGKTLYLHLGALGIFTDDCDESEFQLTIYNIMNKKNNLECVGIIDNSLLTTKVEAQISDKLHLIHRNHSVKIDENKEIQLTNLEYKMMYILYSNLNSVVTYEEIIEYVWGKAFNNQNYRVANLIFHLRNKIEKQPTKPSFLRTIRSVGYMLNL